MKHESSLIGLVLSAVLVATGTLWAFQRGGHDFDVFYHAWRLVLNGHGAEIYRVSPDRFLYAPGFAWLLSPLGLIPRGVGLAIWCLAKAAIVGGMIRVLSAPLSKDALNALGLGAWGVVLLARPFLIDFEYGQVNTFILGACVWALLGHFDRKTSRLDILKWGGLAVAALAKLFPLPLLLLPWIPNRAISKKKLNFERLGSLLGLILILLIPASTLGGAAISDLLLQWRDARVSKGLPIESHNQSFLAFLHHYLSGSPTPVISEGTSMTFGFALLSPVLIRGLSIGWMVATIFFLVCWLIASRFKPPLNWIAVATALVIVPSHLIWKPYFIMGLPAAILVLNHCAKADFAWKQALICVLLFCAINLTGFDVVGHAAGARFEAAATLLWAHLVMVIIVARSKSQLAKPL